MAELQLDKSQCATYNQQLTQELDNYTKVVNEIGTQANGIPGAWTGSLSDNFVSQFNPNIDVVVMNPDEYFEYDPENYQD